MLSPTLEVQTVQRALHPATHIGAVQLTIADLDRSVAFYETVLGLQVHDRSDGQANLGVGGSNLVELVALPGARQVTHHSGLYHFAILTPSRVALAQALRNFVQHGVRLGGSDHLVSEALYFSDPDGNGIEVYRDRPRDEWQYENGLPVLGGLPLDYQGILRELEGDDAPWQGMDPNTVMGHMHLHVSNLPAALQFYRDVVGFDLIMDWNQASFLSAGGYHHHLGVNTWAGVGVPPHPDDAVGLRHYEIVLPTETECSALVARLAQAGVAQEARADGLFVRDPAQNGILFVVETQ
jgi:catechol 2,3-dioxygenase